MSFFLSDTVDSGSDCRRNDEECEHSSRDGSLHCLHPAEQQTKVLKEIIYQDLQQGWRSSAENMFFFSTSIPEEKLLVEKN